MANEAHSLVLMAVLCLCPASAKPAPTATKDPYHIIAERNCFRLTPVPPPQPAPAQPALPLPKVVLTGITTILGNKEALLKVQFPATPGQPAKQQSYILAEGQRDGVIQVVEVNAKLGRVKLNNSGTVMEITFQKPEVAARPTTPVRSPWPRPGWARVPTQSFVRH